MPERLLILSVETRHLGPQLEREIERACADIANDMAAHTASTAARHTPVASEQKIRSLPQNDWWPKLVSKKLVQLKSVRSRLDRSGRARYFSRAASKKFSQAMIDRRLKRRGSLRAGWSKPIQQLGSAIDLPPSHGHHQHTGFVEPARPGPESICTIGNDAPHADKAQRALDDALADTEKHAAHIAEKHLEKILKKYSS